MERLKRRDTEAQTVKGKGLKEVGGVKKKERRKESQNMY